MWKWILGTLGTAGVFTGLVYAARAQEDQDRDGAIALSALAPSTASYWQLFELVDGAALSQEEAERRQQARAEQLEALARIIASEAGTASQAIQRAVAWLARNRSILIKRRLFDIAAPDGRWGPITATRPLASSQPATDRTHAMAANVLDAPQSEDPTAGATYGFNRPLQDRLAEQGLVTNDAAAVMRLWEDYYGLRRVGQVETWRLYR